MDHDELDGALPDPDLTPAPEPGVEDPAEPEDDEEDPDVSAPMRRDGRDRPIVTVGGVDVVLGLPRSPVIIMEAVAQVSLSPARGYAACLAACWLAGGSPSPPKARLEQCGHAPAVWGGKVFDELSRRGVSPADLIAAGQVAFRFLSAANITGAEVKAAKDF